MRKRWAWLAAGLCLAGALRAQAPLPVRTEPSSGSSPRVDPTTAPDAPAASNVQSAPADAGQEPTPAPPVETPVQEPPVENPPQDPPVQDPPVETEPEAPASQGEPVIVAEPAAPKPLPSFSPRYRAYADVVELAAAWSAARPDWVKPLDLGVVGPDGAPWCALELAKPGPIPPAERPTVLLIGGLDGLSLAGGEAVLSVVSDLLRDEALSTELTYIAIPWASPWALGTALASDVGDGRDLSPFDDDHDGRLDEDGPDDLDGDGAALSMLIEDPRGQWTRTADQRFLVAAGPNDGVRYVLCREGRDDDGDGRYNEDPPGGIVLDRNFPLGRSTTRVEPLEGTLPLSAPPARALADLALARRTVLALFFQGNHGVLASPGGAPVEASGSSAAIEWLAPDDRAVFERVGEVFQVATGRRQRNGTTLAEARGACRGGAAVDWFYAVERSIAMEVAWWGPEVELATDVAATDARFSPRPNGKPHERGLSNGRPAPGESDRAWAIWLDNSKGGIGFVEWSPVDLGGGVQALVGGFESRTVANPPLESLPRALRGSTEFVRELVAGLPKLEVRVTQATRDGDVCRIQARVRNAGLLPTGLAARARGAKASALTLELGLPAGAQLFAGSARIERARLLGGESSEEYEWVVLAPEGSQFTLSAVSEWTPNVVREVKP
ncbi:MAG: hypothetical protein IT453_08555 [Planctomycetes bacterium]|nr:hypothetical protein [Planctomycetota bacterium]